MRSPGSAVEPSELLVMLKLGAGRFTVMAWCLWDSNPAKSVHFASQALAPKLKFVKEELLGTVTLKTMVMGVFWVEPT